MAPSPYDNPFFTPEQNDTYEREYQRRLALERERLGANERTTTASQAGNPPSVSPSTPASPPPSPTSRDEDECENVTPSRARESNKRSE